MTSRFALAAFLAAALAACGSSNEPTSQSTETVATATTTPAAAPSDLPASAAPTAEPSAAAATPTPPPSAAPTAKASTSAMQSASATASASPPQVFNQCTACHSIQPGKTIIGPSLARVYGRKAGAVSGFQYSDAMKNSGLAWNSGNLDKFLADPKAVVPGTLMGFAGVKDAGQRKAIIDYLKTL